MGKSLVSCFFETQCMSQTASWLVQPLLHSSSLCPADTHWPRNFCNSRPHLCSLCVRRGLEQWKRFWTHCRDEGQCRGIACQAMLRRPRRCRCSRTGWRHTCSAAATKLFDFEWHLLFLVIISLQNSGPCNSFFTVQATLKMSMMMTINNNVALPILLSVRGFCFLVFLLFFQSLTADARFNWLSARKCNFHSFVQIFRVRLYRTFGQSEVFKVS